MAKTTKATLEISGDNSSIFIIMNEVSHFSYVYSTKELTIIMKNGKVIIVNNYAKELYSEFKQAFVRLCNN